jgi:hypothetical protein
MWPDPARSIKLACGTAIVGYTRSVLPWAESKVAAWVRANRPVTSPPTLKLAAPELEIISDPLAVEGLKDLTAIVNVTSL